MMKPLRPIVYLAAYFAVAYGMPRDARGLGEDELECEEAISHLDGCCPGYEPHTHACTYVQGCQSSIEPELSIAQSRNIRAMSCAQIVTGGFCGNVRDR